MFEVDFNDDGDYDDTGEDVTARLMDLRFSRGRDNSSSLSVRSTAGRLQVLLNNNSGDYSPFNTGSPLTGNLLPRRKCRVRITSPVSGTLWTGWVKSIKPETQVGPIKRARLMATGALGFAGEHDSTIPMRTSRRTDQAIGDILDSVGWASGDRNLNTGKTTMTRWWTDQRALEAMREVETTEGGFLKEDKDGKLAFEDRHHRLTASTSTTSQKTFSDALSPTLPYINITEEDPLQFIYNDVRTEITIYTVGAEAVLWTLGATGADSPKIEAGAARRFLAKYPTKGSPGADVAVDAWSTLVENTDYEANTQAGGGGDDKSSVLTIGVEKYGTQQWITVTNTDTVPVFLTLLQAKGTPVTGSDPVGIVASDSASQDSYEKRTWPTNTQFLPDVDEAQEWCNTILSTFKDPLALVAITINAGLDTNSFTAMKDLDLSHRVTLVANGNAGFGSNGAFLIEAERHFVNSKFEHWVTYLLSPIETYAGFWALDVSKLGTETKLNY